MDRKLKAFETLICLNYKASKVPKLGLKSFLADIKLVLVTIILYLLCKVLNTVARRH